MRVNCYILKDTATGLGAIVDPGGETPENGSELILGECRKMGVKVSVILLTHAHFDHILSLERVRKATGAPLAVHRYDAPALADPSISYMSQYAGKNSPEEPPERLLDDGDMVTVGESVLRVMHTPGHTLFAGSVGRCDLFGGDEEALHESLERIKALSGNYTVLPGHGGSTDLQRERADNIFLR